MSTFDLHPKLFLTNGTVKTTGTSANLTAGEVGLYNIHTHQVLTVANVASNPVAYFAQGSFYASDKLGVHGGYKESIKSPAPTKGIDPARVRKFYKQLPRAAVNQSVRMFWDGSALVGPQFLCSKTYSLRLEVKGEPVLRMQNKYSYKHYPAYSGCCGNDCSAPCVAEVVDAATVLYQFAKGINRDPIQSKFIVSRAVIRVGATTVSTTSGSTAATLADGTGVVVGQRIVSANVPYGTTVAAIAGTALTLSAAATATAATVAITFSKVVDDTYVASTDATVRAGVVAGLEVDVIYSETVFGNDSFNQGDYYNDKFVEVLGSLVYQNTDVCETGEVVMNASTGVGFYEVIPFQLPKGSGELILREFIASQLQSGIFFSHVNRERETTGNVAMTAVDRASTYTSYYMIYSVGVTGNPSNALSHDQYLLHFAIKTGQSATAFEALFAAWFAAFNPRIVLETIV